MLQSQKLSRLVQAFVVLALVLSGSSCRWFSGSPDRYLKTLPGRNEIVGRWIIDAASIERMKTEQRFYPMSKLSPEDHLIVLREDGTCSFKTYSSFQFDRNYVVSEGQWELVMEEPNGAAEGKRAAVKMTLTPKPNEYVVVRFWIARENDKLTLWQYIGDPDRVKCAGFHRAI